MSAVKPQIIYKPSDRKRGETVKVQKEQTEHGERFSLRFANKTFKSTFTNIQQPVCFLTDHVPATQKTTYESVDMPSLRNSITLESILEHNNIKNVKKTRIDNSMGVNNAYILELFSTDIATVGDIVAIVRDSYKLEQDLHKEIQELSSRKHSLIYKLFHPKDKTNKEIKQKVRKLSDRRQSVMKELHRLDLNASRIGNITKGELMPLQELVYPERHFNRSVIIATHKPLEMLKMK